MASEETEAEVEFSAGELSSEQLSDAIRRQGVTPMTPLPAEVEAQIEEIAPIGAAWADDNERHFHLGLMKGARSMAEFDREYYGKRIAQLEAVVKVADRMRLLVNDQTVAAREYDAALAARKGE